MKLAFAFGSLCVAVLIPAVARAEADVPRDDDSQYRTAPVGALELTIGNGFSQGFGRAAHDEVHIGDLSSGGFSSQLGLGYRVNPHLMVGWYVEGARYFSGSAVPDGTVNYSAATGVQATWHFLPFSRIDPWVSAGTGARGYWVDAPKSQGSGMYGVDVLRLRVGADYKLGPSTSIGPMLGASFATLLAVDDSSTSEPREIDSPGLSTFVFAGVQGRFEIGGKRVGAGGVNVASR
jgi:hypothetical protein